MAVYATQDDVLARAGRFQALFSQAGKRPNLADLDELLVTVSAAIDVEIRTHGYDPASISADVVEALKDVAAWAVLVRALPEASPGDDAIQDTVERGEAILNASGFAMLATGQNVIAALGVIADLEAGGGGGGGGTSAGSFWEDLPETVFAGRLSHRGDVSLVNGSLPDSWVDEDAAGPEFRRGMSL